MSMVRRTTCYGKRETAKSLYRGGKATMANLENLFAIKNLTVLELVEIVKAVEEKYGISAVTPIFVENAPDSGAVDSNIKETIRSLSKMLRHHNVVQRIIARHHLYEAMRAYRAGLSLAHFHLEAGRQSFVESNLYYSKRKWEEVKRYRKEVERLESSREYQDFESWRISSRCWSDKDSAYAILMKNL